jgi:hypothetical protein
VPSGMCLVSTVMAVLSSTSALGYFQDRSLFSHEQRMGVSSMVRAVEARVEPLITFIYKICTGHSILLAQDLPAVQWGTVRGAMQYMALAPTQLS